MLAYDLDFALPMRHEYHRRDTRTVVGGFLHVSRSQGVNLKLWPALYGCYIYHNMNTMLHESTVLMCFGQRLNHT